MLNIQTKLKLKEQMNFLEEFFEINIDNNDDYLEIIK